MDFVVADDSKIPRDKLRAFLREGGHRVIAAAENGQEALELVEQYKPEAVIFDISMPVMNGDVAAHRLLDSGSVRHVILASSASMDAIAKPLIARGAHFIAKPYHREQLLNEIARIVDGE